jgi:hypothetical protein
VTPSSDVTDEAASQALLIIGGISLHKFQSVSPRYVDTSRTRAVAYA